MENWPLDLPANVRNAYEKALECARKGDVHGELTHFIHGQLLGRALDGHDFEASESNARTLAHSIMGSFAVRPFKPEERITLDSFRPGGQVGQSRPDQN
jgi:hypothetical protein